MIFLLHHERLPSAGERRLLDAILIGVADHGAGAPSCAAARLAASGNRAVAVRRDRRRHPHDRRRARRRGSSCMELIAAGLGRARARRPCRSTRSRRGLVGRGASRRRRGCPASAIACTRPIDPRVAVLFGLAKDAGLAGDGIRFARALEAAIAARDQADPAEHRRRARRGPGRSRLARRWSAG